MAITRGVPERLLLRWNLLLRCGERPREPFPFPFPPPLRPGDSLPFLENRRPLLEVLEVERPERPVRVVELDDRPRVEGVELRLPSLRLLLLRSLCSFPTAGWSRERCEVRPPLRREEDLEEVPDALELLLPRTCRRAKR